MVKRFVLSGFVFVFLVTAVLAMGGRPAGSPKVVENATARPTELASILGAGTFLIDDFESGSLQSPKQWWTFDMQKVAVEGNSSLTDGDPGVVVKKGRYSQHLQGVCKNWYAGGVGVYFAKPDQDLSKFSTFQIDIFGNGEGSGTVKVELADDDNNNWQIEQDPSKSYAPIYDDKFVYNIVVDWQGWRHVVIPFNDFVDDNPGVGDDIWNLQQSRGSGGLLQLQLVCLGAKDNSNINFFFDNIQLGENER